MSVAEKKAGRVANQGAVGVKVAGNKGAMVEVNIETDFAAKNADFVLGQLNLVALKFGPTGVKEVSNESQNAGQKGCFDLSGRKVSNNKKPDQLKPGLYIIDGRKVVVK